MSISPWIMAGIAGYSLVTTLIASWLASGLARPKLPPVLSLRTLVDVLASGTWMALLYVFGILAIRYMERIPEGIAGYVLLGTLGFLLSWVRAVLYRRNQDQRRPVQVANSHVVSRLLLHNLNYLLLALAVYLVIVWLLRLSFEPFLLIPIWIGALLPDLDSRDSLPGRLVPWMSQWLESRYGHLDAWHTPAAAILVGLASIPVGLLFGAQVAWLVPLGFVTHLTIDMLAPRGIMLLWPWRRTRYGVLGDLVKPMGESAERLLAVCLALLVVVLFLVANLEGPEAVPNPAPSYRQILDRYYTMRGKTQVFAYVEGSWQISARPVSGWFEILNAAGDSYILRDRYSGVVFSAGQTGEDNVYLNRVVLQAGSAVIVKPVEVHLEHEALADALSIVYEMQKEPGVQYIYVSGDLVLPATPETMGLSLQADLSQTSLRKIRPSGEGRFTLHYLTAAELIEIGGLQVETADLVMTATFTAVEAGPTVTPLPSPTADKGPEQ